jgi:chromosome segregation protein
LRPMFVKAIRLGGFKSFADPIVLEFEPGVNVVVGPNGSGKSNISDALAWVLGSQAPSSLRGGTMEDVIFAGSSGRPRLGMAEVELILDNTSRVLPLDLNEVTISRSTDRAGASEYRINGAPCRLLDIAELLSDTGIGRSIHTIVGQGQLDAILQSRPEDRRAFIEEAGQIGKYRRRKDRALRKIERVDDNLLRLNDVLTELRRAIRPLKRQAGAAAQYSELRARHNELRQRLAATEVQRLAAEEAKVDAVAEARRAELLSEELSSVRAVLESAARDGEVLADAAQQAQEIANGLGRSADRLTGLARLAEERTERIAARLAAETEEGYRERIRLLEEEQRRWSAELNQLTGSSSAAQRKADGFRERFDAARTEVEEAERQLARARAEETAAAQALVRAEGSEAAGRATLGSIEARVQASLERRDVAQKLLAGDEQAGESAEQDVRSLGVELDAATEVAAAAETRLEEERERAERLKDKLSAGRAHGAAARARVDALEEALSALAGLAGAKERLDPLIDDARDRLRLASIDEQEAAEILTRAENAVEERWQEVASRDQELHRLDALMSGAADRLAGARRQYESREVELAALDDELSRTRDALAAAERASTEERAALPARRAALDETKALRVEAERSLHESRGSASTARAALSDAELEQRAAEERALAAQLRLEEAESGIADAQRSLAGLEDLRALLREARRRAEEVAQIALRAATRATEWAAAADTRSRGAREQARASERRLVSLRERERELAGTLEEVTRRRNEVEVRRAETRTRMQAVGERAMDEWGLSVDALLTLEPLAEEEEEAAREESEKLDRELRRLGPVNPHAASEYEELAERESFLQGQIEDMNTSKRGLMKVVREIDDTIVDVFRRAFEDVALEFEAVFQRLFPGGSGALVLTDPDDVLASGIEIEARPPGKNIRKLSLLSGGEKSLVALAFMFAIFRSRPSPFYLLDEVEAALDDVNLQRFLGLIEELEETAQVLIVTHQKRTMEAADVLYGVSMAKDGVSQVVAKRMEDIPA